MVFHKDGFVGRALFACGLLLAAIAASTALVACDGDAPIPTGAGTPSIANGERIYMQYCNSCHPGGERGAGPALKPLLPTLSDDQIRTIVRKGKRPMPAYNEKTISNDQLTSLVLFMRTLK